MKSAAVALFMVLAGVGFLVSLAVHLASLAGMSLFPRESWFLIVGIFVVWPPTVLCLGALRKAFPRTVLWKATLRGCPKPMQYVFYGVLAYTFLNSVLLIATADEASRSSAAGSRGLPGHLLVFYYMAFATLYSYLQVQKQDPARRCGNGHVVPLAEQYCAECGSPVGDVLAGEMPRR